MAEEAVVGEPIPHVDPGAKEHHQRFHPVVSSSTQVMIGAEANIEEEVGGKLSAEESKLHTVILGGGEWRGGDIMTISLTTRRVLVPFHFVQCRLITTR